MAAHYNSENITSSFYSSSWFITLFTNQLKSNTGADLQVNRTLLQLWDYFIVSGWKAIFKFGLFIHVQGSDELVDKSFEEIIQHLADSPKNTILKQEGYPPLTIYQVLQKEFSHIPIEFHLERLQKDFETIHSDIKK